MSVEIDSRKQVFSLITDGELSHTIPLVKVFRDMADPDSFLITDNHRITSPVRGNPGLTVVLDRVNRPYLSAVLIHTRLDLYYSQFELLESDLVLRDQGKLLHKINPPLVAAVMHRHHWSKVGAGDYCHIETNGLVIPSIAGGAALKTINALKKHLNQWE